MTVAGEEATVPASSRELSRLASINISRACKCMLPGPNTWHIYLKINLATPLSIIGVEAVRLRSCVHP